MTMRSQPNCCEVVGLAIVLLLLLVVVVPVVVMLVY